MRLFSIAFMLAVGLAGPAALAFEKFAAVENLDLRLGSLELRIPHLALEGTPLTQVELAALFAKGAAPPFAERLARFSAVRASARARARSAGGKRRRRAEERASYQGHNARESRRRARRRAARRLARGSAARRDPVGRGAL